MNSRTVSTLLVIFSLLAGLVFLTTKLVPRSLALYHEVMGERILDSVAKKAANEATINIACALPPLTNPNDISRINQGIKHLRSSLYYDNQLSYAQMQLGRAYCLLGDPQNAVQAFREYTNLRPNNPLGHLEMAFAYEDLCSSKDSQPNTNSKSFPPYHCTQAGINSQILQEWWASGVSSQQLEDVGMVSFRSGKPMEGLSWFGRAVRIDSKNKVAWTWIGNICHEYDFGTPPDVCNHFVESNNDNWLIDPGFELPLFKAWEPYVFQSDAVYQIENCPGVPGKKCASISIPKVIPADGAGLYQCSVLQAGKHYIYSAWIKVTTGPQGEWRPLYYEGQVNGKSAGGWYGNKYQVGPIDWTFFEYDFTAPNFDNQTVCFHPIRLQSTGQAWFRDPILTQVQKP